MYEKLLTSELFRNKKESYPDSIRIEFKIDRLSNSSLFNSLPQAKKDLFNSKKFLLDQNEKVQVKTHKISLIKKYRSVQFNQFFKYSTLVDKYDRHGYKQRKRIIIITDQRLYGLDAQTINLRDRISLKHIKG